MSSFVAAPPFFSSSSRCWSHSTVQDYCSIVRSFRTGISFLGRSIRQPIAAPFVGVKDVSTQIQMSKLQRNSAIILVDHGSKRPSANNMLLTLVQDIKARTSTPVFAAHMELAQPTIADAVDECARAGAQHIIVVPFFLSPGRHAMSDIPRITSLAVSRYAGLSYVVRPPIGTHPDIINIIMDRAQD